MTAQQANNGTDPQAPLNEVGPYKVIGKLGKGGMAEVLLTMQHDLASDFKRLVVVKRVLPELLEEDPTFIQMFLDEARLAARLNHANVVQTYEVGQDGPMPYIAMEFLKGQALHIVQRRAHGLKSPIPSHVVLRIFCDALEGLQYAHEVKDFDGKPLGVIHRDVTPSNIFVAYDGTTKLVDFGIAKSATQREKTRAGVLKGKMAYMAPEQFKDQPVAPSVDVWAMGVSIWETLAGERLFRGKNDFETVQAVMSRPVPKLSERRKDVPPALDAVLAQALERDSAKRLKTAEEMKNKLEEVAFEIGKPLRRSDVGKMMQEFFGEAIAQNEVMVKEFLEKSAGTLGPDAYLRFRSKGTMEVSKEDVSGARTSDASGSLTRSSENSSSGSGTMSKDTRVEGPPSAVRALAKSPGGEAELEGGARKSQVPQANDDDDDDDAPRPVWHWILLVVALGAVGVAVWRLMSP